MNKIITNRYKGLFAILIVCHHIALSVSNLPIYLIPLKYIGFSVVGYFLFISGYGLMYGYKNKNDYLNGFIQKKISRILLPYLCIQIVWLLYCICTGKFVLIEYIQNFCGGGTNWFVIMIILYYVVWYLAFSHYNDKVAFFIVSIWVVITFVVCIWMNLESNWYASLLPIVVGMRMLEDYKYILHWIKKNSWKYIALTGGTYAFLFGMRIVLQEYGWNGKIFQGLLRNCIAVMFCFLIVGLQQKISLEGKVFDFLGKIYWEVYLVHILILKICKWNLKLEGYMLVAITIGMSIIGACILKLYVEVTFKEKDKKFKSH